MLEYMNGWTKYELREIDDAEKRAEICGVSEKEVRAGVMGILLADTLDIAKENASKTLRRGQWPRFYFTNGGKGGIRRKTYIDSVEGKPPTNYWPYADVGHTDEAAKIVKAIFGGKATFDTPKPPRLIERIIQIVGENNALILDSFAGSGTTAHAVLNMNKADGGHRKFILVEMMDYSDSITAERVKRVIRGYGEGKNAVPGTGGNFSFYDLGEQLMIGDVLNENVDTNKIQEYVYFMETREPLPKSGNGNPYYLGACRGTAYYFYYEKADITTLNHAFLATIPEKAEGYVIYADICTVPPEELEKHNITFKKIPRDIAKL